MHSHIISKKRKDQIIYSGSELVSSDSINMAKRLDIPIHLYKINKTINKQNNSKHVHKHFENVYHNYQNRKNYWNSLFNNYGCKIHYKYLDLRLQHLQQKPKVLYQHLRHYQFH